MGSGGGKAKGEMKNEKNRNKNHDFLLHLLFFPPKIVQSKELRLPPLSGILFIHIFFTPFIYTSTHLHFYYTILSSTLLYKTDLSHLGDFRRKITDVS